MEKSKESEKKETNTTTIQHAKQTTIIDTQHEKQQ